MDVDIDFADRSLILEKLHHIPASIIKNNDIKKHNTGVYFQNIPIDPVSNLSSISYDKAPIFGYFKLDFLNVHVYNLVKNESHLIELMHKEPVWEILQSQELVDELFHLHGNYDIVSKMQPKSLDQLAMVLAVKIPVKRHLIGKKWDEIEKEIWIQPSDSSFWFKKSHAISYAQVVIVQMNLMLERLDESNR